MANIIQIPQDKEELPSANDVLAYLRKSHTGQVWAYCYEGVFITKRIELTNVASALADLGDFRQFTIVRFFIE